MENEGSSSSSQVTACGSYPEPHNLKQHPPIRLLFQKFPEIYA
jgi:hypothetical protein